MLICQKTCTTKEHQNNEWVDQAIRIEVDQVDLDWEHKGELLVTLWAHESFS